MDPDQTPSWYAIRRKAPLAAAAEGEMARATAEILIYGDIGESWWEETTSAANFVKEVNALDVDAITVRINSYGGSVSDGVAIHNAIRRHKAHVTTEVDGVAYSIASLIAMAGDTVNMASNALLMIHAPWTYAAGNSAELRETADQLDTWAKAMSTCYGRRTGDADAALALLVDGKDHYYTAAEALAAGYVDAVSEALPLAASALRDMPLNRYRPLAQARAQHKPSINPAAVAAPTPEKSMDPTETKPADDAAVQQAVAKAKQEALAADQERRAAIRASFAPFASHAGVADLLRECEDASTVTAADAGQRLLAHLGKGATPVAGSHISTVADEQDKHRAAATQALMARANLDKADTANPMRGYTLHELARASAQRSGVKTDAMTKMELVAAAFTHSTSDFPLLLSNLAKKSVMRGYEEAEETFQQWTVEGELSDFKVASRVALDAFPSLREVREGAEYKYITTTERGEQVVLATYGELFSITRQAIINDDLGAFTKVPRMLGRAAIRTIGDMVYAVLTANPVMSDGTALFHANHKNLLAGATINTASVDAMRAAMATQRLGNSALNIRLAHLLVPVALQGVANVVRDSEYEVGAAAKNNTVPNSVRGTFSVISDARLDAASATGWYGVASAGVHDTVEVNYLDGNKTPYLEQQQGWDVDGTSFKVRIDAGVAPLNWRAMAKNPGA